MDMPVRQPRPGSVLRWRTVVRPEWLIDAWMELLPVRQAETLRLLHHAVLAASPALVPGVKWGNLVYQRDGRPLALLTPHRTAVHLQLALPRYARQRPSKRGPGAGTQRFPLGRPIDVEAVTWQVVSAMRSFMR